MQRSLLVASLLLAGALAGTALGCGDRTPSAPSGSETPEAPLAELTVADVAGRIARGERLVVVDVNNAEKYAAGHVPGALRMNSRAIDAAALPRDRNTPLVVYCWNED